MWLYSILLPSSVQAQSDQEFVTREGSTLYLGNDEFTFTGLNLYWLNFKEFGTTVYKPSYAEIDDGLDTAVEMGSNVIRTWGGTFDCDICIMPDHNVINENNFEHLDYAIAEAKKRDLRMIITLIDANEFQVGGVNSFVTWRGLPNRDAFYTDAATRQDFKKFITSFLNHTNPYTGLKYKDDPTIMAWELGNEFRNESGGDTAWDSEFTKDISAHVKSIAPHQLVVDGKYGTSLDSSYRIDSDSLSIDTVDMYTSHYYPILQDRMEADATEVAAADKVFFVGEYDWTDDASTDGTVELDTTEGNTDTNSLRADVIDATNTIQYYYYIQSSYQGLSLTSGTTYNVSFYAKASEARDLTVNIVQAYGAFRSVYDFVTDFPDFSLTTNWQEYTFSFTPDFSDSNMMINFLYAQDTGSVWIDDVTITEDGSSTNLISNPTFASGLTGWNTNVLDSPSSLTDFTTAMKNSPVEGALAWQLFPANYDYENTSGDSYAIRYPGTSPERAQKIQELRSFHYTFRGEPVPSQQVLSAPNITQWQPDSTGVALYWRGAAGAGTYEIQRSTDGTNWNDVASGVDLTSQPWIDAGSTSSDLRYYRMRGRTPDGSSTGPWSNTFTTGKNLISNGSFEHYDWKTPGMEDWTEVEIGSDFTVTQITDDVRTGDAATYIDIITPTADFWRSQFFQRDLSFTAGTEYTISFWAKGEFDRTINVVAQNDVDPFTEYTNQTLSITTQWQQHSVTFTPSESITTGKIGILFGGDHPSIWLDDFAWYETSSGFPAPAFSDNPSTTSSDNSIATISAETNIGTAAQAEYGFLSDLTEFSPFVNTYGRSTTHAITLTDLISCTTYQQRLIARDSIADEVTSDTGSFSTRCPGNSSIRADETVEVSTSDEEIDLTIETESLLTISIPSNAIDGNAYYQAKLLDSDALTEARLPDTYQLIDNRIFFIQAYSTPKKSVDNLSEDLQMVFAVPDDIDGELIIAHYTADQWEELDCVISDDRLTATCTTDSLSLFGIFSQSSVDGDTDEDTGESNADHAEGAVSGDTRFSDARPPGCDAIPPGSAPDLFQIDPTYDNATVYFSPSQDPYDKYMIAFSTQPHAEEHGVEFSYQDASGAIPYTLNYLASNTTYYVKVRAGNGCMPGKWSEILEFTTAQTQNRTTESVYHHATRE